RAPAWLPRHRVIRLDGYPDALPTDGFRGRRTCPIRLHSPGHCGAALRERPWCTRSGRGVAHARSSHEPKESVVKIPILCLVGFAGWAVALVLAIGAHRVFQVL